ncbi:hypothetical protein FHL04_07540 [Lactobacillus salsicarnum]|nr:hypothetical protein [Companilactobacillus mishanensis]
MNNGPQGPVPNGPMVPNQGPMNNGPQGPVPNGPMGPNQGPMNNGPQGPQPNGPAPQDKMPANKAPQGSKTTNSAPKAPQNSKAPKTSAKESQSATSNSKATKPNGPAPQNQRPMNNGPQGQQNRPQGPVPNGPQGPIPNGQQPNNMAPQNTQQMNQASNTNQPTPNNSAPTTKKAKKAARKGKGKGKGNSKWSQMNPKLRIGLIVVGTLLVLYLLGFWFYGQNRQVHSLEDKVTSGDVGQMRKALVMQDGSQLTEDQVDSLKRLYTKDDSTVSKIRTQIQANDQSKTFSVVQQGRYMLLYKKYKILVSTKNVAVQTNITNPSFTVNGKTIAAKSFNDEYTLPEMTPGVYDVKAKSSTKSKQSKFKQVEVGIDGSTSDVQMNVKKAKKDKSSDDDTDTSSDNSDNGGDISEGSSDNGGGSSSSSSSNNSSSSSSSSSDSDLLGDYEGENDDDLSLYSDGTYQLGDKSGTYKVISNNGDHVRIQYNEDGGGSVTESYGWDGDNLFSNKYNETWSRY